MLGGRNDDPADRCLATSLRPCSLTFIYIRKQNRLFFLSPVIHSSCARAHRLSPFMYTLKAAAAVYINMEENPPR